MFMIPHRHIFCKRTPPAAHLPGRFPSTDKKLGNVTPVNSSPLRILSHRDFSPLKISHKKPPITPQYQRDNSFSRTSKPCNNS